MLKKGITRSGFEFEVDENIADNMELVEIIAESDDNPLYFAKAVKLLFGEKQKKKLYDHLRTEDGRVPTKAVSDAIIDVFETLKDGKN